jgi:hypothetical protein
VDLFGCPAGIGIGEVFSVLDPLVPAFHRASFHELVTTPRIERDTAQQRRYAVLQTATFGHVHVQAELGVVTATPRTIITLDTYTPHGIVELVPDAPAYGRCK